MKDISALDLAGSVGLYEGTVQFEPMFDGVGGTQMFLWETASEEPIEVAVWYLKEDGLQRLITDAQIALARIHTVRVRRRELEGKPDPLSRPRPPREPRHSEASEELDGNDLRPPKIGRETGTQSR